MELSWCECDSSALVGSVVKVSQNTPERYSAALYKPKSDPGPKNATICTRVVVPGL